MTAQPRLGKASRPRRLLAALIGLAALLLVPAFGAGSQVPGPDWFPSTNDGIHVFDDQLPGALSDAQLAFVATRLDGTQKVPRSVADALHARNPDFVVLQYRLGLGLGYRASVAGCEATGAWIFVLDGDRWVREWPRHPKRTWFSGAAPGNARRYLCEWGWYLVNTDQPSWRRWFSRQVSGQAERTGADGVFLDSVSVPNQFQPYKPDIPAVDPAFEQMWSRRIESWLPWLQARIGLPVVANAGWWVTSRDTTDYSGATGVMVEGFAQPSSGEVFVESDWVLQMNRVLGLARQGRVVISQAYPDASDVRARLFVLGSYLLVKGEHSFVNLEVSEEPTWFPEYDANVGAAADVLPSSIEGLRDGDVYVRRYANATVVVNPGATDASWSVPGSMARLTPVGGGVLPESAEVPAAWLLRHDPVGATLTLGPREAAILVPAG